MPIDKSDGDRPPGPTNDLSELYKAFNAVLSGQPAPAGLEETGRAMVALRASLHGWPQRKEGVTTEKGEEDSGKGTKSGKKKKKKAKSKNRASVSVDTIHE
jgi:hypothetical protein